MSSMASFKQCMCLLGFLTFLLLFLQVKNPIRTDEYLTDITGNKYSLKNSSQHGLNDRNDQEHHRFSELLKTWPMNKPKAAIYYLLGTKHFSTFNKSIRTVHRFFIMNYEYPIIIFHENGFNISKYKGISKPLEKLLFFQEVRFKVPDFIKGQVPILSCAKKDIGYRHMCRFNAKTFSDQPILQQLEYVWRLDDDSFLTGNVTYDVFRYMQNKQLLYGYNKVVGDHCIHGLWNAVRQYAKTKNMTKGFHKASERNIYFNNFEISAMSLWWSKGYRDYIEYIDRSGGIYHHRWGDAPIKTLAVHMLVPEEKKHYFEHFPYGHSRRLLNELKVDF